MTTSKRIVGVFLLAGLLLGPAAAVADVITVCWDGSGDYLTIQQGLDAAVNGDEVVVCDGTYAGANNKNLDFGGKAITVRSENGPDNCIIDCQDDGRGFYFHTGETAVSVVDGFTITNGYASDGTGGGVYCENYSSPTITNCTITENTAAGYWASYGGGIYCDYSSPTITNCTITGNVVVGQGAVAVGGGVYCWSGDLTITNCTITGNTGGEDGGGVSCTGYSNPTITNCTIADNTADFSGGVFSWDSNLTMSHCTITGNAGAEGAILLCYGSRTITNCTITGNSAVGVWSAGSGTLTIRNCTITGNAGGGTDCESHSSPTITNCRISGNAGTGVYCLEWSAPTITNCTISGNAGPGVECDLESSATITNCTITENTAAWGGAVQCFHSSLMIANCILWNDTPEEVYVESGDVGVSYSDVQGGWPGEGNIDADPLFVDPNNADYHLSAGSPCIDAADSTAVPPDVADLDEDGDTSERTPLDLDYNPRFVDDPGTADTGVSDPPDYPEVVDMGAYEFQGVSPPPSRLFVDADATGANDGTSWEDAYNDLQDALDTAAAWPEVVAEIWVAEGTYTPDRGTGDREATFQLLNSVGLYGGFAGWETSLDQRDVDTNATILSGDLLGDDGPEPFENNDENSYHVVTGSGTDETAVLDGVTITAGHTSIVLDGVTITAGHTSIEPYEHENGGGMYNSGGSPTLANCTFSGNITSGPGGGGGMYNSGGSSPTLTNCTFSGNQSTESAGGMLNWASSPTLTNCTFSGNFTSGGAGGMENWSSSPTLANCTFSGNVSGDSGAMYNWGSSPTLTDCTFSGNYGAHRGGGMGNWENSNPTLTNCTFNGNHGDRGGGMYNRHNSNPTLTNCTFSGNSAFGEGEGGAGMLNSGSSPTLTNCTFSGNTADDGGGMCNEDSSSPTLTNCILWGDTPQEIYIESGSSAVVTYCDVQGGWAGTGNIDADPLFVDPNNADYHVSAGSPCIDAADDTAVPPDVADLDEDGDTSERTPLDLDYNPRFVDDPGTADTGVPDPPDYPEIVDMGAYEYQVEGKTIYVDDDAPNDPGPGDPTVSDPDEDGSPEHPFDAIQEGIDAANDGDEVIVLDGTYTGPGNKNLDFGGKAITVRSASGDPALCIIDCEGDGRGFYFHSGEGPGSIVEGLTITNGSAGVLCSESSPTLTGCTISGNSAAYGGGGVYCFVGSSPTLTNCTISGNSAGYGSGGGVYCEDHSSPTLTGCTISGNLAGTGDGGGVCCVWSSSPALTNCTINGNSAGFGGGGVDCSSGSSPALTNCTISGNSAGHGGGGVYCSASSPTLTNCTISGNSAGIGDGGGVYCSASSPALTNCTISGNSAEIGGGGVYCSAGSSPTLTNCILWGDTPQEIYVNAGSPVVTYCDVQGGWAGTGNIDADPLFVDDYHLAAGSPCIDAADDTAVPPDVADLDEDGDTSERTPLDLAGDPRFVDDPGTIDTGVPDPPDYPEVVDMGAYEFQGVSPPQCPPGTFPLTDAEGDFAGWCLSTSHPDSLDIYVDAVDVDQRFALIQLSKDFTDPPGFGDLITPMLIDFVQVSPDELTANMIYIADESVTNSTGVDWTDYHWILFDGPEAWFDVAASWGFDTSPFAVRDFEDFIDPPVNNQAKRLSAAGGVVPDMTTFFPGDGTGELVIGVDLSGEDAVSFTLKERPSTDAVLCMSVESNADGASIAVSPADIFGAGNGQADFRRYYQTAMQVSLTAAPRAGGRDFIRWKIDGTSQPVGQRTINVTMSETCTAQALYRSFTPSRLDAQPELDNVLQEAVDER